MHVFVQSCTQAMRPLDMEVTLKMYMNVSEMHEWRAIKMEDFLQRIERALTREFSKPIKERHRVLIEREDNAI